MKIFDDTSLKKLISLIKGDINKKQDSITATGILTRDDSGTIDGIETETATLIDIPNGILKGDGTTISVADDLDDVALLKTFTTKLPPNKSWPSVCYGDGKFVTVNSYGGIAAYSTNGITWTQTMLPISAEWSSVCYGNDKFVAVSYRDSDVAAYSTDGINWTQTTLPVEGYWNHLCYGNGKFVVVDSNISDVAAYSTDGINWTQTTMPTKGSWASICYGNGKFVAVSSSSIAAYSTDGINWTQNTMPASTYWASVCYGNDKFLAITSEKEMAAYSTDGINWTQTTMPYNLYVDVCYGDGKFVAVSYSSKVIDYSIDGIIWNRSELPIKGYWNSICYGNGKFVAVANSSIAACSIDGATWFTEISMVTNLDGTDITANFKEALGINNSLPNGLLKSDGTTISAAVAGTDYAITPRATLVTLSASGWDSSAKTQSASISGVLADENSQLIVPMPAIASQTAYNDAGILCTGQGENTVTFTCDSVPTVDIKVYVFVQSVSTT